MHHFYLITDFSGNMQLGGEEAIENSPENSYKLEWHKLDDIENLPLKPDKIKEKIKEEFILES